MASDTYAGVIILPLESTEATLGRAGGKGTNLARLARAGYPVPSGFLVTAEAYRAYAAANELESRLVARVNGIRPDDPEELNAASEAIRAWFAAGTIPADIADSLRAAYRTLGSPSVAVRSSATAEDLPDLSFAGQQDTFLNVVGEEALLAAVVKCWSSLWTARAIGYRARNQIPHNPIALAVVVQTMVPSAASGVLFTANPLTGLLSETVIDATFGLGEALVSGQVEPDHFVVNSLSGEINSKTLGTKQISTRGKAGGGVETLLENAGTRPTLSDNEIRQLTALGQQVQKEYGTPQDIEWAFAGGQLYLLQSRAITSLFPVPQVSFDPLIVWFSFGAVQGLVGPVTPLGRDAIQHLVMGAGRMFSVIVKYDEVDVFVTAGERIWIKISDVIRNPIGSRIFGVLLESVEPSVRQIVRTLAADPRLGVGKGRLKFSTVRRLAGFFLPVLARLARNMLYPDDARARFDAAIADYLSAARIVPADDCFGRLANIVVYIRRHVANAFQFLLPQFIPVFGPSMAALNLLNEIAGENRALALEVTRGLPNNVTTEMDLALWETATAIRADVDAVSVFHESNAQTLASHYLGGTLPPAAQTAIARFMERYGMRGVGEIDFGQTRWREDPTPVMHTLQSYLHIDPDAAPDVLFAKGDKAAHAAIEKLAAKARRQHGGWLKEKVVRAAARRIRLLMGARESPKFFAIRAMGVARQALLEVGKEFVAAGTIDRPDDLVFLKLSELEALSRNEPRDWKALVAERRTAYERELRRRQVPRVLVSDGRAFYEGIGAQTDAGDVITGSPVSPGVVEGLVHVVLDPRGTQLAPGEILVCPGTDPAWTPLFLAAGGLVMEVGGMMTHGSVVAREYGIPAVVGVDRATHRLKTGQRIRVDGSSGQIKMLGE
jgi:rifampicin phosphotransferase